MMAQRVRAVVYPMAKGYRDNYRYTVRACTGARYAGRTRDYHGYWFGIHGYFDWRNVAVALACCDEGHILVEIGANVGTETVSYRDIVGSRGRVIGFEPVPENVRALEALVELNAWTNVEIHPIAISDRAGEADFVPPPDDHATGVGHLAGFQDGNACEQSNALRMECRTLDSFREVIGKPRAIFCDAEGAEILVVRGAGKLLRECQPVLVLEASPKHLKRFGATVEDLHALLRDAGYIAFNIGRWGFARVEDGAVIRHGNWLCVTQRDMALVQRCQRLLRWCAVLPCIRGINPLCR